MDRSLNLFVPSQAERGSGRKPLYERIRPNALADLHGQPEALAPNGPLASALKADRPFSFLLWGPPGTGKSTLAHIAASNTRHPFVKLSAVFSGVKEVRKVSESAQSQWRLDGQPTLLFIDEIHRYNKSQQDALLPYVEEGSLILIGATTENPAFEINAALLSRMEIIRLEPLEREALRKIAQRGVRALAEEGMEVSILSEALDKLIALADGDARVLLRWVELAAETDPPNAEGWTADSIDALTSGAVLRYDKSGDEHYDLASAFIKSMRGSDPDAAVYWMARMLGGGESPRFVARRMVIFASEDVGLADRQALVIANAAFEALERVGLPEAEINLSHAAVYLALAPKSNRSYKALRNAQRDIAQHGALPVPPHLRNAPTQLAKSMGHGKDYQYPHDAPEGWVAERYLPEKLGDAEYYRPGDQGDEPHISAAHRRRKEGS